MPSMRGSTTYASTGDDHRMGLLALSPLALLCLVIVTGVAYWFFTQLQITSTEQSVLGLLQADIQLRAGMTVAQIQAFMNGSLDHNQTIADAIGWGVQIALIILSFSPDTALLNLHHKYNSASSASLMRSAATLAKLKRLMMIVLVGGDIVTDFYYVVQGHNIVAMHGMMPTLSTSSAAGVIIVGLIYPTAVCFVNIFVGKFLFVFIEALVDKLLRRA